MQWFMKLTQMTQLLRMDDETLLKPAKLTSALRLARKAEVIAMNRPQYQEAVDEAAFTRF